MWARQEFAEVLDHLVPDAGYQRLPLVGVGGSAGAIEGLRQFFAAMPPDAGMAFVVVIHLDPAGTSRLVEVLRRMTAMTVVAATANVKVAANHVYVCPPGKTIAAAADELTLAPLLPSGGQHVAIDTFFRSLAEHYGPHAAALILSGADADGAVGLRAVRERGGLTLAQSPEEAEHPTMPRVAISGRAVDIVAPVAELAQRLLRFRALEGRIDLPLGGDRKEAPALASEGALDEIRHLLTVRSGHDHGRFDRTTLVRRIAKRMQLAGIGEVRSYAERLRTDEAESAALTADVLAVAGNFFRDPHCFEALRRHLPRFLRGKGAGDAVRVWVAGCATGEEAYSIAMLLLECTGVTAGPTVQVFATDISAAAIEVARTGLYMRSIAQEVTERRLRRFFTSEPTGYRVASALRESVVFAVHDVLADAPFARLDLVCCRNLLISLGSEPRRYAGEVFHQALRRDGWLFLGAAEAVTEGNPLFSAIDADCRLYRREPVHPSTAAGSVFRDAARAPEPAALLLPQPLGEPAAAGLSGERRRASRADLLLRLFERLGAPSLIVDAQHEVLHFSQPAARYLHITGGEPSRNLLCWAHPMLRLDLEAALAKAAATGAPAYADAVGVELEGHLQRVDVRVSPALELAAGCLLVLFSERRDGAAELPGEPLAVRPDAQAEALQREVQRTAAQLQQVRAAHQAAMSDAAATQEALQASNEELQSMNEELRIALRQVEVSREELQSTNIELAALNAEMKDHAEESRKGEARLKNLLSSVRTALVFLDPTLSVRLYTPAAAALFGLATAVVGRPLAELAAALDYPMIEPDAEQALTTLMPIQREVRGAGGSWFLAKVQPYRMVEDQIAGVFFSFTDITAQKIAEARIAAQRDELARRVGHLEAAFAELPHNVCTFDREKRFVYANRGVEAVFGTSSRTLAGATLREAGCPADVAERLEAQMQRAMSTGAAVEGVESESGGPEAGGSFDYSFAPLRLENGEVGGVVGWSVPRRLAGRAPKR